MKKFASVLLAGALCASCLAFAGCGNDEATETEVDPDIEALVEDLDPVGSYVFDSIAIETADGEITAAGIAADWEGTTLTEDYATVEISENGTLVCSGALEAEGTWAFDSSGFFGVELELSEGEVTGTSIDSDGMFGLDIALEDGSTLYYYFLRQA